MNAHQSLGDVFASTPTPVEVDHNRVTGQSDPAAETAALASTSSDARALEKAKDWIQSEDSPDAEGEARHAVALEVATKLHKFGIAQGDALELIAYWNVFACTPELDRSALEEAVEAAYLKPQQPAGLRRGEMAAAWRGDDASTPPEVIGPSSRQRKPTTKLEWALDAARRGFRVLPLLPNTKIPAIKNWVNEATTHPVQITAWWTEDPDYNVGGCTSGMLVVDIDPRNGGVESFKDLELLYDFPLTQAQVTAGEGMHRIYDRPEHTWIKNSTSAIAPGVDIKGDGGQIVLPGSTINGNSYRWAKHNAPRVMAPDWLLDLAKSAKRRPKSENAGKRLIEETEAGIEAAETWLANHAPDAVQGKRDNTAYKVAAKLYDYGLVKATVEEMLTDWNYQRCFPPLEHDDIARIAASAGSSRQNPIGALSPDYAGGFEPIEVTRPSPFVGPAPEAPRPGAHRKLATRWSPVDVSKLKKREWVFPGVIARQNVSILAGPAGVSKSTLLIAAAVAAVTGRSDICGMAVKGRKRTWLWNQEDDIDELQRRLAAVMQAFNVSYADLCDEQGQCMLFLNSGVDKPLTFATRSSEGHICATREVDDVIADIQEHGIECAMFDPLVEFHVGDENKNAEMRAVLGVVRRIAVQTNCAAFLAAHTRKPDTASSRGFAGEMDALRGASAQVGVVRSMLTLFTASPKDAKEWRMEGSHRSYVRLDTAKNNLAAEWTEPKWFKREGVAVGGIDGDNVGILRPVELKRTGLVVRVDILETLAAVMKRADKAGGAWHTMTSVIEEMTEAEVALLPPKKNRARDIKKAFDGANEYATNSGTLLLHVLERSGVKLQLRPFASTAKVEAEAANPLEDEDNQQAA
jgi:hypothetical protein